MTVGSLAMSSHDPPPGSFGGAQFDAADSAGTSGVRSSHGPLQLPQKANPTASPASPSASVAEGQRFVLARYAKIADPFGKKYLMDESCMDAWMST